MNAAYFTLGCKVNHYDTQSIAEKMACMGYEDVTKKDIAADVVIINTCAVTNESERKSRQLIRRLRMANPNALIVVTGCYAQINPEQIKASTGADLVFGTNDREHIPLAISKYFSVDASESSNLDKSMFPSSRTRAYLKIQDGCKMFCSYCIVPYARNNISCLSIDEIVSKAKALEEEGYKEIVITGIHLASYKHEKYDLADALKSVADNTGIERIRLGSLEPKLLSERFISRLHCIKDKLCPHFHISLQSASPAILAAMNRHYSPEYYMEACNRVRENFEDAMITTDIIVGFPSEGEKEFEQTCEFVKKAGFSHVHIFPFSPKKGTPAASFENQVPNKIKHMRVDKLGRICTEVRNEILCKLVGRKYKVLCEKHEDNLSEGFSSNYLRVKYHSKTDDTAAVTDVKIVGHEDGVLTGEKLIDLQNY